MTTDAETPDPWAIGTPITETHPLHATIAGWDSIESTLAEWGIPQAEQRSKAIAARLAALDPPVLMVHPHEMKDEADAAGTVEPSDEYYEGVKDGINAHAIWSDGERLVGALQKPISQVFAEVDSYQAERRYWKFG